MPPTDIPNLPDDARLRELSDDAIADEAVNLAASLLRQASECQTRRERVHGAKLARLMADPQGKAFTIAMSDQVFRSGRYDRIASQLHQLIKRHGVPRYLSTWEQVALWFASAFGEYIPRLVVPRVVDELRSETRTVILPAEEPALSDYLQRRRNDGFRLNLNQLGEAILGEDEARRRLEAYVALLKRPDVEYISVKISSVVSQVSLIAFDDTVEEIKKRLRVLYRTAAEHRFATNDNNSVPKFVNLDMEEYGDLHLTVDAFRQTLDEEEFKGHHAGIVLQAYLPDAHQVQRDLTEWALKRVEAGGAPIKLRIVKGANLAMEKVEAALHGWEQAPYHTKPEVDANYKRMLVYALQPQHARAVRIGIASHNLFDIAYGLLMRAKCGTEAYAELEMLEGMANHQARTVKGIAGGLLLYAPVVKREDFHSAISYLMRRLDENTAPENFLHDLFGMRSGDDRWQRQSRMFLVAAGRRNDVFLGAQRSQDRNSERREFSAGMPFKNEPDTDWSLRSNQAWIRPFVASWRNIVIDPVPLQVNGNLLTPNLTGIGRDPGAPDRDSYRYAMATMAEVGSALKAAAGARAEWAISGSEVRGRLLMRTAELLAQRRGDLIGVMMRDTGKTVSEGDVEVSEAIDLANYYARSFTALAESCEDLDTLRSESLGTVLVTPPWNFPLAIPAGGVLAALMAGNTVVLKPAPEAVLTSWHLCNALWDAGIPKHVLQFLPAPDDAVGQSLVTDERVSAIILTGAYDTGRLFKHWKPELPLFAETSGKNSMIITALADHDQAIKDLVKSAFGHAGQKCSAASLAVLEAEVYDSPAFLKRLRDAVASLKVGAAWDLSSSVTPVVREPREDLRRGLTRLDEGETWLLQPRVDSANPQLWSPGIRLGVKRGSWFHRTECFGPILGLMRAESLADAIDIVNDSQLGLTSGIHSLDDREISLWRDRIEAGNGYINRGTTGAIVQRQPFGGWKKSAFGTAKAGGPNYVLNLCRWHQAGLPNTSSNDDSRVNGLVRACKVWIDTHYGSRDSERFMAAAGSYRRAWSDHFSKEHDPSNVLGEVNIFRYRPIRNVLVRVGKMDDLVDGVICVLAAATCGVRATLSIARGIDLPAIDIDSRSEDDRDFIERISSFERVRAPRALSREAHRAANSAHTLVIDVPVLLSGRLELRHYLREQSITQIVHRYGSVVRTNSVQANGTSQQRSLLRKPDST